MEVEAHSEVEEEEVVVEVIQVEAAFSSPMVLRLQFTVRMDSNNPSSLLACLRACNYAFCRRENCFFPPKAETSDYFRNGHVLARLRRRDGLRIDKPTNTILQCTNLPAE